ncbi:MAG: methionine adenosyltransferase [Bacteroidales bacterium]|nr:methionine adenosyltransferase [Candidatus Colimorpha onthohippi]
MSFFFTSESVSKGHPDKVADQISDAILDEFLRQDATSKVACETMVTTGLVIIAGEVKSEAYVDLQSVARRTIKEIGYTKCEYKFEADSCGVVSLIHEQSGDIYQGVRREADEDQGAGDQGMMFGYACKETEDLMPLPIVLSHMLLMTLDEIREEGRVMTYLRPDAKSQFTVEYSDDGTPLRIDTIVLSTQHDDDPSRSDDEVLSAIRSDVVNILLPRLLDKLPAENQSLFNGIYDKSSNPNGYKLYVNPTGKFVIGGPHGDTGLTGRKIIVDTYGGRSAHGGGAFSGKDSSKVDRSAAYAARHIAKNMVAAGLCSQVQVQLAYAIGEAEPVGLCVNTFGTSVLTLSDGEIASRIRESGVFGLTPFQIVKHFGLTNPIFRPTAAYGHFGRTPYNAEVEVYENQRKVRKTVRFFAWEDTDKVEDLKRIFNC